jgi:phage terminase large subunit-like protein
MRTVQRTIYSEIDEGFIKVLAADVDTADGIIVTLGIVDELHRAKSIELYGAVRDGLGPRNGRMITISTAGSDQASPLGLLRDAAHKMPGFRREGKYNYVRSPDGAFAFHEWCLDPPKDKTHPGDDVDDLEVVKLVNPAPWQTLDKLRKRHDDPATTPWQWKRFACGLWTEGEEPWMEPEVWDALADPEMTILEGSDVFVGVDIGVEHDSTGIAVVSKQGKRLAVKAIVIPPPPNGSVSLEVVENALRDVAERFKLRLLAYDPWSFRRSGEILESEGIPVAKFPQSPERMSEASANLYRLIDSGELIHDGDPQLRAHVMAGSVKETGRGWRLDKDPRRPRVIDALIALVMAAQVATEAPPEAEILIAWE